MTDTNRQDVGTAADLAVRPLTEITFGQTKLALSHHKGVFGVISGVCNHAGGPLGQGKLDGKYVVCPWHNWKFHRITGCGEPGSEDDAVPSYKVKVKDGRVHVRMAPATPRKKKPHAPHPLARSIRRKPGPVRVVGISATAQDPANPRYSTSEALLEVALAHARKNLKCPTKLIKLADLKFRACEGYYSKSAQACTWPCSITQMDDTDELTEVYEALVHWRRNRPRARSFRSSIKGFRVCNSCKATPASSMNSGVSMSKRKKPAASKCPSTAWKSLIGSSFR
jgi:nitrite reductase/ring-hydroxylating ferredoxin subunit